jgi:hypothetical protein
MSEKQKWKGKRKRKQAPELPDGFVRQPRGPTPKKPKLFFNKAKPPKGWPKKKPYGKWYIYYHKNEYSTGNGWGEREEADGKYQEFCRDVRRGREARKAPGQITFKDMIESRLAFLKRNANTRHKLLALAKQRPESVWWLRHFGNMKLIQYRPKDSTEFQTWYVKQRTAFYLKNPEHRGSAANGANCLLRSLRRFCEGYARDENTGWYPDIHIPDGEEIPPGPFFRRSEQAAMLLTCRGWQKDRKTGKWKTKTYVDEDGFTRVTHRVLSKRVVDSRKGKSRGIRTGVRVGAREQDLMSMVWGVAKHTACVEVDDDGAGTFHRRGTEEIDTNKSRPSSIVPNRLKCLFRIWKKEDGQGNRLTERDRQNGTVRKKQRYLVRQSNGRPYKRLSLAGIVKDAGLPANYTEHALRRTAVEEAHLQCWSMPTASHMCGMSADVLLKFYTDWNERAARSEAQALREANSKTNAKALRGAEYASEEDGDRVRHREHEADKLWDERQKAIAADETVISQSDIPAEEVEALAALRCANARLAAHRLRRDDLERPEPAADVDEAAHLALPTGGGPSLAVAP